MTSEPPPFVRPEWYERAACRGTGPELFYFDRGKTTDTDIARAVCAICPVCAECLALANERPEEWGVWGGKSVRQRRRMRRRKVA